MKKLLIIGFVMALFSVAAMAQINADDTPESPVTKVDSADHHPIYYRNKGSMALSLNNHIVSRTGIVSLPVSLGLDATVVPNFTMGPMVTYLQMKNTTKISEQTTQIRDQDMKYHQVVVGMKGSYHIMPLIQNMTNKPMLVDYVDVYLTAWAGYSFMFANHAASDVDFMRKEQKVRGGAGLGVRSMVLPRFGFFVEAGYNSTGYASFGLTTVIK